MNTSPLFGFVVLHYEAEQMTRKCVDCLLVRFGNNMRVVVVDNGSPNGSGPSLAKRYQSDARVDVLLSKENLGFAAGNNLGYVHLRTNYDCDFVAVMNNDVLVEQNDFVEKVHEIYQDTPFAVLGPDIYEPATKRHRNPYRMRGYTKQEAKQLLASMEKWNVHFLPRYIGLNKSILVGKLVTKKHRLLKEPEPWEHAATNVMLQGSCYVFSRDYLNVRSIAFCPDTFLYFEEAILCRDCEKLDLVALYDPRVRVTHLGSVSTRTKLSSNFAREHVKNERHLSSVRIYVNRYDDLDVADR